MKLRSHWMPDAPPLSFGFDDGTFRPIDLLLPPCLVVAQPEWVMVNTSPALRPIATALTTPLNEGSCLPITAVLSSRTSIRGSPLLGRPPNLMIATTALCHHPGDAATMGFTDGFLITANQLERHQVTYRKYGAAFANLHGALPGLCLPTHVILNGFQDLVEPIIASLGEWGQLMSRQFMKCPPMDHPQIDLVARIGDAFGIDLFDSRTLVTSIVVNLHDFDYPQSMSTQSRELGEPVKTRLVQAFFMCILPLSGALDLAIIGYKHLHVPEGMLLVLPARLWVIANHTHDLGTTITVAF